MYLFVLFSMGFFSVVLMIVGVGLLSVFFFNYMFLVIFCFFVGVGLGGGLVYMFWFFEFVFVLNSGVWMVVFLIFWIVGMIIEVFLGWVCLCFFYLFVCNLFLFCLLEKM